MLFNGLELAPLTPSLPPEYGGGGRGRGSVVASY